MRFVISLFSLLLMATAVFPFPFKWFTKYLAADRDIEKFPCNNVTYWKTVVEKVKKEHPSADYQEMVKFISHAIMNDSSTPLFGSAGILIPNASPDSRFISYANFVGSLYDGKNLFNNNACECEMDNNLSLFIVLRKNTTKNNGFSERKKMLTHKNALSDTKNDDLFNSLLKTNALIFSSFRNAEDIPNFPQSCTTLPSYPKLKAIIEKTDNMSLPTVNAWARSFMEEFKVTFKPLDALICKFEKFQAAEVMIVDEPVKDFGICFRTESPKCHTCFYRKGFSGFVLSYLER